MDAEEDFIITDITPEVEEILEEPHQIKADLLFDLPLNTYTEVKVAEEVKYTLNEEVPVDINHIEVFGAEEVVLAQQVQETRFVLEDFDAKPTISKSSQLASKEVQAEVVEETVQFELKTRLPQAEINTIETRSEEVSPLDLTIVELQKRAQERREKMKGFNYKFNDQLSKNIDEIERQPAYKRQGLDLSVNAPISKVKTAIQTGENLDFKSNNSFLHDNVD